MKSTKFLVNLLFTAVFLLITFFGIGPVLLADGSDKERMLTLLVVLLIYAVWFYLFMLWRRKSRTLSV
ncbi:DUF6954 family protein [Proteiniclasticum sp.]|uniref:DUF6954 family protein n=1 Tax=Proteiniclasticum sp. TaxID=2053595 RepID=UPI00289F6124|nr:hypothetical protein [Proteiniclasticum sp.]